MSGDSMIETFDMRTNFKGLIQLLAKSMYSEPDVFIRELIQNAHDSIVRHKEENPNLAGKIEIHFFNDNHTILVRDNGIGMDERDIKDFLAVIGSTGTGESRRQLEEEGKAAAYELIGQFGVGMLSAFVVAEKVVVRTRKLGADNAYAWHNSGSTECRLFADNLEHTGSEITITVSRDYSYMLDDNILRKAIKKYCDFIPFPILLNGQGPVNTIEAPWQRVHWPSEREKEAAYRVFINQRYPDTPVDIIPVDIQAPFRAKGALYITDQHIPDVSGGGVIDIYVRRMFIRDKDNNFLPQWAKFIRGVIDSPDLKPTAARDNIQRNDEAFRFLQEELGRLIVHRLKYLAANEPNRFKQINRWHHYHLKGMAFYYDEFFKEVGELLLFETNKGLLSLREYLPKNAVRPEFEGKTPIYYFSYAGGAAQFYRLAEGKGWVVINAGLGFEESLLEKYARLNQRTVHPVRLDATDDKELFQRLDPGEEDHFHQLELDMEGVLRRAGVVNIMARMRRFDPLELPAVIILSPETEAELKLERLVSQPFFMEGLEDVAKEALDRHKHRPLYLSLNSKNPLIRKLASVDRNDKQVQELMVGIHNSAILYSQNLIPLHNLDILHSQFLHIIGSLLESREELVKIRQTLEEERRLAMTAREKQQSLEAERPDHILIFMITPFGDEYKPLEMAVRRIFEAPPYFFQVRLARDRIHKPALEDNVREHIRKAHGFVAEISELNPNVMLELGAAMLQDSTRPVFSLRSQNAQKDVPADLKGKLFVPYKSLSDPPQELEKSIRGFFERDGRTVHDDIDTLLKQRKKRFLSKTLLEQMQIKLDDREIREILNQFETVEDVLDCDPKGIEAKAHLVDWKVAALCGELKGFLIHA